MASLSGGEHDPYCCTRIPDGGGCRAYPALLLARVHHRRCRVTDDGRVISGPVCDFDFHPDEDQVREFTAEPGGVLRFSSDVYVRAARYGDVVLWHYAFVRHWFKINLTTDLKGQITETGGDEPGQPLRVQLRYRNPDAPPRHIGARC